MDDPVVFMNQKWSSSLTGVASSEVLKAKNERVAEAQFSERPGTFKSSLILYVPKVTQFLVPVSSLCTMDTLVSSLRDVCDQDPEDYHGRWKAYGWDYTVDFKTFEEQQALDAPEYDISVLDV